MGEAEAGNIQAMICSKISSGSSSQPDGLRLRSMAHVVRVQRIGSESNWVSLQLRSRQKGKVKDKVSEERSCGCCLCLVEGVTRSRFWISRKLVGTHALYMERADGLFPAKPPVPPPSWPSS